MDVGPLKNFLVAGATLLKPAKNALKAIGSKLGSIAGKVKSKFLATVRSFGKAIKNLIGSVKNLLLKAIGIEPGVPGSKGNTKKDGSRKNKRRRKNPRVRNLQR
jgi:hypothetical protein